MKEAHAKTLHKKVDLLRKLNDLEQKVSQQKTDITSSVFKLKKKEMKRRDTCSCIGQCIITHTKHNFIKSRSEEFFLRINSLNEGIGICTKSEIGDHGAIRKRYTCNQCDKDCSKQGDLKRHCKSEHRLTEEEIGEVREHSEKGRMSQYYYIDWTYFIQVLKLFLCTPGLLLSRSINQQSFHQYFCLLIGVDVDHHVPLLRLLRSWGG